MSRTARAQPLMLWLYITRQIAAPFAVGLTILLFSLSLERLLRLIDMVAADGAPASRAFMLMIFLIPHYLSLALPAAFFLAVLLAFRGLHEHLELAIVQSAGISLRRLLLPVMVLSAVMMTIMLLLAGYIEPYARYDYRAEVYELSASGQILNLQPGVFTSIGKHMVARAEGVTQQGQKMASVFVTATNVDDGITTYAGARSARVEKDKKTGLVTLILENGNMVREQEGSPPQTLTFDEYPWKMESHSDKIYGPRGRDQREMTFQELMAAGAPGTAKDSTRDQEITELHARLVQAASLPFLALLALPLALIGGGRTGKAYGIAVGISALILYDKILGFGEASASRGHLSPWIAQWLPWLALVLLSRWALAWKVPHRLKTVPANKAVTP